MRERPILFSGTMVRAILNGTKTQTRRVVKWRHPAAGLKHSCTGLSVYSYTPATFTLESQGERRSQPTQCPYGQVGDRLWVRETWAYEIHALSAACEGDGPFVYRANPGWMWDKTTNSEQCLTSPRWAFANLWEKVNGEFSWDANPWVWVVEFKRIPAPTTDATTHPA